MGPNQPKLQGRNSYTQEYEWRISVFMAFKGDNIHSAGMCSSVLLIRTTIHSSMRSMPQYTMCGGLCEQKGFNCPNVSYLWVSPLLWWARWQQHAPLDQPLIGSSWLHLTILSASFLPSGITLCFGSYLILILCRSSEMRATHHCGGLLLLVNTRNQK